MSDAFDTLSIVHEVVSSEASDINGPNVCVCRVPAADLETLQGVSSNPYPTK